MRRRRPQSNLGSSRILKLPQGGKFQVKGLKLEEINAKFDGRDILHGVGEHPSIRGGEVEAVKGGGVVTELAK